MAEQVHVMAVKVPLDLLARLDRLAHAQRRSRSFLTRDALEEFLAKQEQEEAALAS